MTRVLCALVAVLLTVACTDDPPAEAGSDAPTATAHCGAVATIPIQGEGHLVGDQEPPVPYNSTPPTSGWHTSVDIPIAVAPEPLTEPELVTVLELGGVVVAHNGLDSAERRELETAAAEQYPGEVATTEYDKLGAGEVALAAWGVLQTCTEPDLAALDAFVEAYAQR